MLDTISQKIRQAGVREIIKVKCCIGACTKEAEFLIALRFSDARTDLYGVCKADKKKVEDLQAPLTFGDVKEQGFFLY